MFFFLVKDGAVTRSRRPPRPPLLHLLHPQEGKKKCPEWGFKDLSVCFKKKKNKRQKNRKEKKRKTKKKKRSGLGVFVEVALKHCVSKTIIDLFNFVIRNYVWKETRLQSNWIICRMITVRVTGLVIPSANNRVVYVLFFFLFFISNKLFKGV